ncbi:MAG: hypothetical protein IPO63_11080 [Bacteroidetes bacterium]|nr:hypothetical protein [Bacteroidota bacterium]
MTNQFRNLILFGLFIFLTRVPFLFDGFGSEEDAWAMHLVAERIGTTGIYEVSRLPGHPVQELIYSSCWKRGPLFYNLLTAIISTLGIIAFVAMLRNLSIKNAYWCAAALAFTPIVFINSSNAMDYTWAMSFILLSGYFISKKQILLAASMLALGVGCRITSGAMLLPYSILLWNLSDENSRIKNNLYFIVATLVGSFLVMSPVIYQYGLGFFTYYEHFPIPNFLKNAYKGSIAVWGIAGCFAIAYYIVKIIIKRKEVIPVIYEGKNISIPLITVCAITILLYTIAFINVPLKAAFIIPICPFLILGLALFTDEKSIRNLTLIFTFSCLFLGVNLAEDNRGSSRSDFALLLNIAEIKVAIDPFQGLVLADQSKRKQQILFAEKIINRTSSIRQKTILISGWWNATLQVLSKNNPNDSLIIRHYIDEPELIWLKKRGYDLFYIEDQGAYNDLRFNKKMTDNYAQKLKL